MGSSNPSETDGEGAADAADGCCEAVDAITQSDGIASTSADRFRRKRHV